MQLRSLKMPTITNGTVEFSRRLKTGDYEHKDAKVTLSFTVDDGQTYDGMRTWLRAIAEAAVSEALVMVGEKQAGVPILPPGVSIPAALAVDSATIYQR